jgi:hypothetical protein
MSLSCEAGRPSARARSHTLLRRLLADRAAILHRDEHALLLDAADALLFDESDALAKQASGQRLLAALVDNDRWLPDPAAEVRAALDGCAVAEPVLDAPRAKVHARGTGGSP